MVYAGLSPPRLVSQTRQKWSNYRRRRHAGDSADLFIEVHAAGRKPISIPGLPISIDGITRRPGRLPSLGEHTEQVLAELESRSI